MDHLEGVSSLSDQNTISLGISIFLGVRVLISSACERIQFLRRFFPHPDAYILAGWQQSFAGGKKSGEMVECINSDKEIILSERLQSAWDIPGILKEVYKDLKIVLAKESCRWKGLTAIVYKLMSCILNTYYGNIQYW